MAIDMYVERLREQPRRWRELTVIAQDPSVRGADDRVITAKVRVPEERLEPGPRGHRFHVVDYDASRGRLRDAVDLAKGDIAPPADLASLEKDNGFHAQNVYAIAARTLAAFEAALGRRVPWGFAGHQLSLVPHAFQEANAFYAEDDHALYFGYFDAGEGQVFTCLSHDVVAHETTHAILDGLRDRFDTPGLPDQAAFHEAFADIVALLSAFALPGLVEELLGRSDAAGRIAADRVDQARLAAALGSLAEQLGRSAYGRSAPGLRNSLVLLREPSGAWRTDPAFEEPHRRGEVLVAAVMGALLRIWRRRLEPLIIERKLDRGRAAEDGAKAAEHLLKMCIRALDYLPPLEFEFADLIDALLVSDREMEPNDRYGYRDALAEAFGGFGIAAPVTLIKDLSDVRNFLSYHGFNYVRLRSDSDEVFRFMWQNATALDLDLSFHTDVEDVRQVVRVGPDGFVVSEVMVDYVQRLQGRPAELAQRLGFALPRQLPPDKEVALFGGGVLVFDQFGRAKYHQRKALADERRQKERLAYLLRTGRNDSLGRYGFSDRAPKGQRFAELHRPVPAAGETW